MGRWWTGYTSISAGRLGIAHSHGEPWLFAATERLQPAYGYGLWKAKIPSEKMCSIAVCGGAGCEVQDPPKVPRALGADAKLPRGAPQQVSGPTPVGGGCFLGGSAVEAAETV